MKDPDGTRTVAIAGVEAAALYNGRRYSAVAAARRPRSGGDPLRPEFLAPTGIVTCRRGEQTDLAARVNPTLTDTDGLN